MAPDRTNRPFTLSHRDPAGLFALEATVGAVTLTFAGGTLHDADKGAFPLAGLQVAMHPVNGRLEPGAVRNPGELTEFQQEGLLDAVRSALGLVVAPHTPTSKE
jgi:hypothetical protein